jgi:hypothetical protein
MVQPAEFNLPGQPGVGDLLGDLYLIFVNECPHADPWDEQRAYQNGDDGAAEQNQALVGETDSA